MKQALNKINAFIWNEDLKILPLYKRALIFTLRILQTILRDIAKGELSLRAMSLVYTTVISLVPLLAISFSVLKGFGAHKEIEPALLSFLEPLGDKRFEIAEKIVGFVDNIQIGVLGALGIALLIYSVVSMMQKIERSFNFAWKIKNERSFSERFSDYLSVLMLGPLFIFLSVAITTSLNTSSVDGYLDKIPFMGNLLEFIGFVIPYLIMACAFGFINFYMPNTNVKPRSAFVGGLFTAVIWKIMGMIFSTFIASSSQQTAIYSAFASIIVFMVWIYVGWLVLLIGASIASYHQHPKRMLIKDSHRPMSFAVRNKLALTLMTVITKNHYNSVPDNNTISSLAEKFNLSTEMLEDIANVLTNAGFIISSDDIESPRYYPAKPLEQISLHDVVKAIELDGDNEEYYFNRIEETSAIESFLNDQNVTQIKSKANVSLQKWVE